MSGVTGARAEAIRALARAVCQGNINFTGVIGTEAFLHRLCEIPGISKWTVQYVGMRALGQPDAFPSTDLALLRALKVETDRELERRPEQWRPWRAYAALYLWRYGAPETTRGKKRVLREARGDTIGDAGLSEQFSSA